MSNEFKKHPIGLIPKKFHDRNVNVERFNDVCGAIVRYYEANLPINVEWVVEYNELLVKLKSNE